MCVETCRGQRRTFGVLLNHSLHYSTEPGYPPKLKTDCWLVYLRNLSLPNSHSTSVTGTLNSTATPDFMTFVRESKLKCSRLYFHPLSQLPRPSLCFLCPIFLFKISKSHILDKGFLNIKPYASRAINPCLIPSIYNIAISMKKHIIAGEVREDKNTYHIDEHMSVRFGTLYMAQM